MKEYKNYIFDLDGTLLNTLTDLTNSVNHALNIHHMPLQSEQEVKRNLGSGLLKLMEGVVPNAQNNQMFNSVMDAFKKHYLTHSMDHTAPYPGVNAMLKRLKNKGKHIAIVSNKFDAATKQLAKQFFHGLVDVVVGENMSMGIRRKPHPDGVNKAMTLIGANHDDTVYIGDSDVDILTARNSNLPCISVLWGFRTKEFLTEKGAATFVEHPDEIF